MPLYRDCPIWQGLRETTNILDFGTLSKIIGIPAGSETAQTANNVIGFMCDKYAIMHTNIYNRVGVDPDNIRDVTYYEYQYTDKYMNNMNLNGVVFVLEDVA